MLRTEENLPGPERSATPAYDRFYYLHGLDSDGKLEYGRSEHWLNFFGGMADRIVSDLQPGTVLDAGCAMGILVESLRDRGVDAYGIDVSEYALANVREDIRPFCSLGSVTEPLPRRYDLITCIETLEHLQPDDAERAVANICEHTDDVLFSSTPDHFKESTHLNVRPPEYWAEMFARQGLHRDVDHDPTTYLSRWAVRFRRLREPATRIVRDYERWSSRLKQENLDVRQLCIEGRAELAAVSARLEQIESELAVVREGREALAGEREALARELERIKGGVPWRLSRRLRRAVDVTFPQGTRRRAALRRVKPLLRAR
jgi:SAM-dependent methyltransferase